MKYFSYDPLDGEWGFELHSTAEQAKNRAALALQYAYDDNYFVVFFLTIETSFSSSKIRLSTFSLSIYFFNSYHTQYLEYRHTEAIPKKQPISNGGKKAFIEYGNKYFIIESKECPVSKKYIIASLLNK
ncbi:hypothetical protein RHO12_03360 [Orbus sturtevantii]|uniref:hypothetical protein n=1 Tax=Orbus sturtevantii TaxID=3074109 RepID=UPI00370CFCE9